MFTFASKILAYSCFTLLFAITYFTYIVVDTIRKKKIN